MTANFSDFYLRFENHFRGSREDIKSRQRVYLPLLDLVAKSTGEQAPAALDMGCGRGEWLENLKAHGWQAIGCDINPAMIESCRAINLDAEAGDGLAYLRSLPAESLLVISAFHVVEHIPFEDVLALFAESLRVLKPGGLVIFETPNPENLQVGGHTFYLDPTHVRPVPPALLAFAAADAGFARAEILRLHPRQELGLSCGIGVSTIEKHASQLSFGPQDYSVVAMKSPPTSSPELLDQFSKMVETMSMHGLSVPNAMGEELRCAQEEQRRAQEEQRRAQEELDLANNALQHCHQQYAVQEKELGRVLELHDELISQHAATNAQLDDCLKSRDEIYRQLVDVSQQLQCAQAFVGRCADLECQIDALHASTSWRLTLPLRVLGGYARRIVQILRQGSEQSPGFLYRVAVLGVKQSYRLAKRIPWLKKLGVCVLQRSPMLKNLLLRAVGVPPITVAQPATNQFIQGREGISADVRERVLAQLGLQAHGVFTPSAIHQFVHSCAVGDGVSNGALFIQKLLREAGIASDIYCVHIGSGMEKSVQPLDGLASVDANALLLVHHSCGHDDGERVMMQPMPKVMVYHNITPAAFFAESDPLHHYCKLGREQLLDWLPHFIGAIGDSELNTSELLADGYRNARTIPLLVDLQKIYAHTWNTALADRYADTYNILFVGRIVENKCQHELVEVVRVLRQEMAMPVKLLLAGGTSSMAYLERLQAQIADADMQDAVELLGKVTEDDLYALYRCADVFVCLSEHEGFGMPLIEAMAFGVPVLASASGNIPNTLGEGGILLTDKQPATVARTIALLANEPGLRRKILQQQQNALRRFDASTLLKQLSGYLADLGIHLPETASDGQAASLVKGADWRIEGPIQGSYSLAFVNRGLARGLVARKEQVGLYSMDAGKAIPVEATFIAQEADLAGMLESAECTPAKVVLRDCYPPRTDGMAGQIKVISAYGWEESTFPERFVRWFNARLDMVTVLSQDVAKSLRDSGIRLPITVVGGGVDHHPAPCQLPEALDLGTGFRFLHISSCFPRKGVDVLLRAFGRAFRGHDDVTLIIKTFPNPHNTVAEDLAALRRADPDFPRVILISEDWPSEWLNALYAHCHAFVAPSRGEGFGLPLAEAMLHDLPVITLAAGGQADFCSSQTAWLCDYRYAPAQSHLNVAHSAWREPDEDDLVRCLQAVHQASPEERQEKTSRAKAFVQRECTWEQVAARTMAAVARLAQLPVVSPVTPIAWLTTWNTRCGIANYSDYLLTAFPQQRIRVLANRSTDLIRHDQENVSRCWETGALNLSGIIKEIDDHGMRVLVIQYNFGFFPCESLARLIEDVLSRGVQIHLFLHSTRDVVRPDYQMSLRGQVGTLAKVERIYVHGIDDRNYLKAMGLDANVVLFPHGVLSLPQSTLAEKTLAPGKKTLASYGFLLPHKGIKELVLAFIQLGKTDPDLHLLLANALYPIADSALLRDELTEMIEQAGMSDRVTRAHEYLPDEESLALLEQADLVVYPYQHTQESSSAAVRMGLAAGCAVAVTPLPIFDDVSSAVLQLPGVSVEEIARGIDQLINDPVTLCQTRQTARQYREDRAWPRVSNRLLNIIDGLQSQKIFEYT